MMRNMVLMLIAALLMASCVVVPAGRGRGGMIVAPGPVMIPPPVVIVP